MTNYNRVILAGNLTRDPESKFTQSGLAIVKFGMAVNRRSGKGDDAKEETCFVDVTAFGKTGEMVAQYFQKGSRIFIEGRLNFGTWEKDGEKRSKLDVVAENFQFVDRKGEGGGQQQQNTTTAPSGATGGGGGFDSIPF